MEHWSDKYIGLPWTEEQDCFFLVKEVQEKEFGRDIFVDIPHFQTHKNPALSIAKLLTNEQFVKKLKTVHWYEVDKASDGDILFLSQRTVPHHVGVAAFVGHQMEVLHSLDGIGVLRSTMLSLRANAWKVARIVTWR